MWVKTSKERRKERKSEGERERLRGIEIEKLALLHFRTPPLLLLMIHHKETRLNANPNPKGSMKVQ